jgi:hypothetical protein
MSDENTTEATEGDVPNPFDEGVVEQTAVDAGIAAIKKIHAIERELLSRAVQVICELTSKTPQDVITNLSKGLDGEYDNAVNTATASAKVAKLYVPNQGPDGKPVLKVVKQLRGLTDN